MYWVFYRNYEMPADAWLGFFCGAVEGSSPYRELVEEDDWDQVMLVEFEEMTVTVVESWDRKRAGLIQKVVYDIKKRLWGACRGKKVDDEEEDDDEVEGPAVKLEDWDTGPQPVRFMGMWMSQKTMSKIKLRRQRVNARMHPIQIA